MKRLASYSPDLNLIENIWCIIKAQLMKKEINKCSELITIIKEEYDSINEETIAKLNKSFPSRLHQWIKKEKDWIFY